MKELEMPTGALTTAHLADACVRVLKNVRCAALYPVVPGQRLAGSVVPVQHFGSVDVFLEAIESATIGDVLVIDNGGRRDESCIGDLVVLEAVTAGLGGIVAWGCHRDTAEIRAIDLPVFSTGAMAAGPIRLDARTDDCFRSARVAGFSVSADDIVVADDDGALFISKEGLGDVIRSAERIRATEVAQAERVRTGVSLREQLRLREYLEQRRSDAAFTFRRHLRAIGGAIEE